MSQYENAAIAQVSQSFQSIKKISQSEYDVGLGLALGMLFIRIKFQPNFPNTPPRIYVASNVSHPLIGEKQQILYPELSNWSPRITLLSVVQNIYNAFTSNPPKPVTDNTPKFAELLQKWNKQIEDEQDMIEFVSSFDDVSKLIKQRDTLLEKNLERVNENLRKKEEYDEMVREHQGEVKEIEELTGELAGLMINVEALNKQYSPEKVLERLKEMEAGFNKEAAEILKCFMKKDLSAEEFIEAYQVPMRRAKFIQIAREAGKKN